MSDNIQQLVTRAQNSDIDSFRQLVEKHQQFAYNVAFRFLTNQEDARDVVQECFIRLWKNLHKVDPHKKLTTWLYKIVLNLCYDEMRRAYNRYKCDPAEKEASFENLKSSDNMEKKYGNEELAAKIRCLSEHLKPRQRAVFILRDLEDLDLDEISEILKISVSAVKSNLFYARQNIRKKCLEMGYIS